jgi:hypothetical protein
LPVELVVEEVEVVEEVVEVVEEVEVVVEAPAVAAQMGWSGYLTAAAIATYPT